MTSYATLDQQQHEYAFASHATKQSNAYPQHGIQIDEFGGPVNAYTSQELAALAATPPLMELAAVDEQLGSEFMSTESSDLMAGSSFDELGGVIGNIDDELSGQSEGLVSSASSRTWYYPDGTVVQEGAGEASASAGSSASELDQMVAELEPDYSIIE